MEKFKNWFFEVVEKCSNVRYEKLCEHRMFFP